MPTHARLVPPLPLSDTRALRVFAATKVLTAAALLGGFLFYFTPLHPWSYLVFSDKTAGPFLAFINWDGQHYLRLALAGYPTPADPSSAFCPLFPALIRLGLTLGLGPIAAGLAVTTLASLVALWLLARLLPLDHRGDASLWLFASFPTAFYLSTVYAEGLFLALLFGLLLALRDVRPVAAAISAFGLPLTRAEGLWLAIPLAMVWIVYVREARISRADALRAATLGYGLGVAAYLGFFAWRYGDPLEGLKTQQLFVFNNAVANLYHPSHFIGFLLTPPAHFLDTVNSGLDKSLMLFSLSCLALGARRTADPFVLTLWVCFAVLPALMGEGGSYARHALLAWACFVIAVGPRLERWLRWLLVAAGFALQTYLAFCFGANRWVG